MSSFLPGILRRGISTTPPLMAGAGSRGMKTWKGISLFLVLPCVAIMSAVTYYAHEKSHKCFCRPPFVKYEYLRIRNKRYPWGDGNKTAFHNPHVNPLPDGYEDELEEAE